MGKKEDSTIESVIKVIEDNLNKLKALTVENPPDVKEDKSGKKSELKPKIEVGSEVEWIDDDDDEHEGKVTKIKGETATVVDEDDDEFKVDLDDLELALSGKSEKKSEPKIEVGSEVEWKDDEDEHEGKVTKIKGDVATVVDEDDDEFKVDLDDLELV